MCRGKPLFQNNVVMAQNQSFHLRIDNRIRLIPISMDPVQFWQCEDWIFDDENKNPVTAPPDLHQCHWCGYQMNYILNSEVQGLYRSPLPSVSKYRVSPYFRTALLWPRTTPCTSILMMGFD